MRGPIPIATTCLILTCAIGLATAPAAADSHLPTPPGVFPDFGFMVDNKTYRSTYADEPLFRLKADFPVHMPPDSEIPDFIRTIDFRKDPLEYLRAVQIYAFEGNLPEFGGGPKPWDPYGNEIREWYHIPWLHVGWPAPAYPPNGGTEGFHGLIKEAPVSPLQLAETQIGSYQVYANTLVNSFAGYTLGQMWADPNDPNPGATDRRFGGGFPIGTVFAKFLFTDAPGGWVIPYLDNAVEWNAYITEDWDSTTRAVKKVRLLQMDIMVRDPRADDFMGWVFGTFVYNGAVDHPHSKYLNLVPLGLQWGNEPGNATNAVTPYPPRPIEDIINTELTEQQVFTEDVPPQHMGWNGRLNGPADLNTSSCMSCHATAQYPAVTSLIDPRMVPAGGPEPPRCCSAPEGEVCTECDDEWMTWFQNIKWATPMDPRTYSADFSLQVVISLDNYFKTKNEEVKGIWAVEYEFPPNAAARDGQGQH